MKTRGLDQEIAIWRLEPARGSSYQRDLAREIDAQPGIGNANRRISRGEVQRFLAEGEQQGLTAQSDWRIATARDLDQYLAEPSHLLADLGRLAARPVTTAAVWLGSCFRDPALDRARKDIDAFVEQVRQKQAPADGTDESSPA
jgi:hypothetical protein